MCSAPVFAYYHKLLSYCFKAFSGRHHPFLDQLRCLQTFCRQFLWHALMLWPEDMPQKSVISVSAHDDLVPAKLVARHLQSVKSPAKVITHPTAAHGGIFLDNAYQNQLVASAKHVL